MGEHASLPDGVESRTTDTSRIETHYLESGDPAGDPLVLLHGNVSSARFWAELMVDLPDSYRAIAPDLRGYGQSATAPVNATRGMRDFADDVGALLSELGVDGPVPLVGWSNGGGVALRYTIDRPESVSALVLQAPISPHGFGGTKDIGGNPCYDDYAGSGGGTANEAFTEALAATKRTVDEDTDPRVILNNFYVDPEFDLDGDLEEAYLTSMLSTAVGEGNYPGDVVESDNWPGVAPGDRGVNNAISPKYCDLTGIVDVDEKPDVLWIRGDGDQIVSNTSFFDLGFLGQAGEVPGWPGDDEFPPQPMVDQTRAVFDDYADAGGSVEEVVFEGVGHSPHVERHDRFRDRLTDFLV